MTQIHKVKLYRLRGSRRGNCNSGTLTELQETDRSQATLDPTDFPKKFWKNGNMTPLQAVVQKLNNAAEWRTAFSLNTKKPQIPLCRQHRVNKTLKGIFIETFLTT